MCCASCPRSEVELLSCCFAVQLQLRKLTDVSQGLQWACALAEPSTCPASPVHPPQALFPYRLSPHTHPTSSLNFPFRTHHAIVLPDPLGPAQPKPAKAQLPPFLSPLVIRRNNLKHLAKDFVRRVVGEAPERRHEMVGLLSLLTARSLGQDRPHGIEAQPKFDRGDPPEFCLYIPSGMEAWFNRALLICLCRGPPARLRRSFLVRPWEMLWI